MADPAVLARLDAIEILLRQLIASQPPVTARDAVVDVESIKLLARQTAKHGKKVVQDFNARRCAP